MFLSFLILPTLVPEVKIDAPVPTDGMTTTNSAPDPVNPVPSMPGIALISIVAVV